MLAQRIFDKTQIKYNEGVSTSFELTQAQNQLLTSQGNYINSTLQLLNARTRLNKALSNL
jgi:outer membrane protein TolC